MQIKKDHINFAVGPVLISEEIQRLGSEPVPYFRTPDFSALMKENEALMKMFVNAEEGTRTVFLTGSGTAAMEAAVINVFDKDDKLLVVNGGSFGQRFCEICDAYNIPYDDIKLEYGKALTQRQLLKYDGGQYTGCLVNMHETSSGVLYDMKMIGDFCKRNNLVLVVDAISSFIADELDMQGICADIVLTGSQKALAVPPGVSILVINKRTVKRIYEKSPACYYLDLKSALKNGERGQTPFTPAVGILIQINSRLNQIRKIGLDAERKKIKALANDFRNRINNYPFKIASDVLSNAVTPISPINEGVSAYSIFTILKEKYNIIVCPNGGELADKVFRVGHIGALSISDNDILFQAFDDLKAKQLL